MKKKEESNNNGIYLVFALLIVVGAGVAYARLPAFRGIVDTKAPSGLKPRSAIILLNIMSGRQTSQNCRWRYASDSEDRAERLD